MDTQDSVKHCADRCFGSPDNHVQYADQILIWSFRFFTSFMYIYFDVLHGHFIIFHCLHVVLKLVEAAD